MLRENNKTLIKKHENSSLKQGNDYSTKVQLEATILDKMFETK